MPYHYRLTLANPLPSPWDANPCWVICDHPFTVAFERLDLVGCERRNGKRTYLQVRLPQTDIDAIQAGLRSALGLK